MMLGVIIGLYLTLVAFALFFSNSIMFPAPPPSYELSAKYIKLKSSDGNIIAARELKSDNSDFWVLFSHGNGVDLELISDFLERIPKRLGCSVLAYDYPGYGASSGSPSERSVNAAAKAALLHLRAKGVPEDKIIIWGRSIGGGPSTRLAYNHKVAALILESAFMSAFRVVTRIKIVPFDKFDSLALINSINCPKLFIHGKRDRIIPFTHGENMFEKAKGPKSHYWLNEAGHNDVASTGGDEYWKRLSDFIHSLSAPTVEK